ncbi:conserved repeat domain protein, partial [Geobacter metallireducens RCH3]
TPSIKIIKYTNGDDADLPTGPMIPVGGLVTWTYVVTNTGNVDLANVVVTDDKLGAICTIGPLATGASQTCTKTGTAVMGQYANTGTVTGTFGTTTVTDQNPSHYFGVKASIDIRKQAEGPDTRNFPAGSNVPFEIVVTNTGNVALNNVVVTDQMVPACNATIGTLNPGQIYTYTCTAPMVLNNFTNTACTEGMAGTTTVTDCDDSTVVVTTPKISIKKYTNGDDADLAPGPYIPVGGEVKWEYVVTNTGNVDLTNVVVTDDKLGAICTIGPLAAGASQTCTKTGTAVMGQYANMGTVTGQYNGTTVTDQNPSHYFGVKASIDIRKQAEGPDTRSFPAGSDVPFEIVVTNTGNVALNNVKVTDQLVPACNTTIGTLNPGQVYSYTCTAPMVLNGFTNTACTEGMAGAVVVTDCDDSTVTVTTAKIDIAKYVSIDGKTWFHTDSSDVLKVALCATCEEEYDKEHCDYNHDNKCDERDVDYCKSNKYECDRHDSEHGSNKRKHRCDDSSNKSYCEDKAEDAHERDHSDYNNDGKCDERDIDYCRYNKSTCDRHDADHHSTTRSYRCDDSYSKTTCESKKKDEEKSDKERSDYNRDGKCDERDVAYCQNNKSSCDSFDRDRGNLKRRFRCDDSTSGGKCEDMARTEHDKDDGDYNNDGKCDERDIDYCKYNRSACDQHDKNHGSGKRTYRCDDSSNESSCEDRVRKEHDHDRSDYDHDGKLDEDDIKYCQENKDRCVKQDRDYSNCKRTYRCDDSEHREDCGYYAQREHDKDDSDYNHDGKCDERDIDYCKNEQERCDEHDRDHKLTKRTYRCDDSSYKDSCGSYAQREHDKDRSDYNRDGKRDERDIDYCKGNDEECIKHDKGHGNFTRSYRCDESSNKTLCESTRYSQNKSEKDDSDYNRDGKCDERDISYCKYNRDACDKFDSDRGNRKRTYRCDDSSYKTSCQDKAEYEHDRDHADYNRDGKCDERDIDNCKNSPYGCDDHDRDHGDSKRHYRCDDSYDKTRCEERSREERDRESSCSGSGSYPSPACGKVYFKYLVTNTGSTTLTNLTLTDDKNSVSSCTIPAGLNPDGSFSCIIGPLPAKAGLQVNTATATGTYGGVTTTDTDKAYYYGCDGTAPKSPGYWKNHPEAWPVESITIGGKTYTKAQAISLMNTPVSGDKTYTLFKALVAAKLDAMGCGDSSCVTDTIAKSDAWMALHPVGSGVAGDSYAWKQAEPWYLILDDYINGKLVCGGSNTCTPPPPPAPTCGQCSGGTTKLALKYTGDCLAKVEVKDSNGRTLFSSTVAPDSSFNFTGMSTNGTMGQYVKVYVNGSYKATIYTDCSKPIYPGMGIGSFNVVEGYSLNGGKFCRVSSSSCTSYDDDHYSSDYCGSHDGESSCLNFFDHESSDSHHDD